MTIIRFTYSAGYHRPATGGVVFMPHRKHAANETVVLPRPFTRTLVDGVVEVDLEPTSDDWLWSVTHDQDTRFYAIPDTDGVINHTDLIPVAPSTLTHRIEPVWWAELRQHQQFITDYVNESRSNVREAIDTVNTVHTTLKTAVTDAQRHESVAGAYSRQAQASATEAWEASKGPDGAAERAKAEADRAEIYRNEANTHRIEAGVEADRAEAARDAAETYRDEAVEARDGMIIDASVVGDDLLFDTVGGDTINAGNVRGPQGEQGEQGQQGEQGEQGPQGEPGSAILDSHITATTATGPLGISDPVSFDSVNSVGDAMTYADGIIEFHQTGFYMVSAAIGIDNPGETVEYVDFIIRTTNASNRSKHRIPNTHTSPIFATISHGPVKVIAGQSLQIQIRTDTSSDVNVYEDTLHTNKLMVLKVA